MTALEIIGAVAISLIAMRFLRKVYRHYHPKKYTYENCPADHDTQSRYGTKSCSTCGTMLNEY